MRNFTFINRGLLCAALLMGIGGSLQVSAQTTPAPAKPEDSKPAPRPTVYVGGAIKNPGPINMTAGDTLSDVLARAVWLSEADLTTVRVIRREKVNGVEKTTTQTVNFESYLNVRPAPDEANNPTIKDKDRIFVGFKKATPVGAEKQNFTVYAGGAIKNPGPLVLNVGDTLAEALARAVWMPDADLTAIRIVRREKINGVEKTTTQSVNFEAYMNVKAGQVPDEANNPVIKDKDRIFIGFKVSKKAAPSAAPKR